jgi:hypothetical protein
VDKSAWRAARSNQLLIGGWCPPHRDIGFGKRVPDEFPCQVTPHDKFSGSQIERSERTRWNVHAAEATLVLRMPVAQGDQPKQPDRGTDFTIASARELGRPFLICDPTNSKEVDRVVRWIRANEVHTLNVGGPRDDAEHKISSVAEQFLSMVFAEVANAKQ